MDYREVHVLISKLMANRLSPFLQTLTGRFQSGFMTGRNILERVMMGQEVILQSRKIKHNGNKLIDSE